MRYIIILLLLGVVIWAGGFAWYIAFINNHPVDTETPCGAIVVPTGSNGRVEAGFEALNQGRAERLFITGVNEQTAREQLLKEFARSPRLRRLAVQKNAIQVDKKAKTTYQNAEQTRIWAEEEGISSICLMTARYHMPRAYLVFRSEMPEMTIARLPVKSINATFDNVIAHNNVRSDSMREYHKLIAAFFLDLVNQVR